MPEELFSNHKMQWVQAEASSRELCSLSNFFETFEELVSYAKIVAEKRSLDITTITSAVLHKVRQQLSLEQPELRFSRPVRRTADMPTDLSESNKGDRATLISGTEGELLPEENRPQAEDNQSPNTQKRRRQAETPSDDEEEPSSPASANPQSPPQRATTNSSAKSRGRRLFQDDELVRHQLYSSFGHLYSSRKAHDRDTWLYTLKDKIDEAIKIAGSDKYKLLIPRAVIVKFRTLLDDYCAKELSISPSVDSAEHELDVEQVAQLEKALGPLPTFSFRCDGRLIHTVTTARTQRALSKAIINDSEDGSSERDERETPTHEKSQALRPGPLQAAKAQEAINVDTSAANTTAQAEVEHLEDSGNDTSNAATINQAIQLQQNAVTEDVDLDSARLRAVAEQAATLSYTEPAASVSPQLPPLKPTRDELTLTGIHTRRPARLLKRSRP